MESTDDDAILAEDKVKVTVKTVKFRKKQT